MSSCPKNSTAINGTPHHFDVALLASRSTGSSLRRPESEQNTRRETQHGAAGCQQQREAEATPRAGGTG